MSEQEERPIPADEAAGAGAAELSAGLAAEAPAEVEALAEGEVEAARPTGGNEVFRELIDRNFLEYASYVIKDRAIPDVDDGLKPVQRRILWAMHKIDDKRTNKAAFVVGEVMGKYHPHGDASIKDALVVLANKEYYIERQGNFGNLITGSPAAAARYIECGLTPLAREVLFNDDITELVDTYDGRNQEPVVLPVKIPSLLMLGSDGIAVGMATRILPHNFNELLQAQIAVLRGESFALYPDFQQGGLMDVSEYADGNGRITLRARIEVVDRKLVIREIPATTTTESLIASIEKAAEKGKIKIASVRDYTSEKVEIEVVPTRGYDVEKALQALYMYTDCSVSISPNMTVIRDLRPTTMTVTEVIERNTSKLLEYLRRELEINLHKQNELFHAKTLAQIFFENRIYKRIEECEHEGEEYAEVRAGVEPFLHLLRREVTDEDIDRLLALPVRRIARFDIEKNQRELREIEQAIAELKRKLKHLTDYAIGYLEDLIRKYGAAFPRRTEIEKFEKIDRKSAALNNIKIGHDRKTGYLGTSIRSEEPIICNEFDHLLLLEKSGSYKITDLPGEKLYVGKLYDCRKYDPAQEFGILYRDVKSGKYYGKRSVIGSFIKDKVYQLIPENCRLEVFTPRPDAVYELTFKNARGAGGTAEVNLKELPLRSARARGVLVASRLVAKFAQLRYLTPEELAALSRTAPATEPEEAADPATETVAEPVAEVVAEPVAETVAEPVAEVVAEPVAETVVEPVAEVVAEPVAEVVAEPVAETVVEPVAEAAAESAPVEESAPVAEAEVLPPPSPVKVEDWTLKLDAETPRKKRKSRSRPAAAKSDPDPEPPPPDPAEPDDLGIIQPEFGF